MADVLQDYAATQEYLFGLKARGVSFGIDRMAAWVDALGRPHLKTPVIHIAGTNGKGSVAAMLEAILRRAGWRTGLYTSPHLVRLGERVQVDRQLLRPEQIVAYTRELMPVAEKTARAEPDLHPTFFEFMTAMAFLHFERSRCDIACVEVGMGGRLDATNVVVSEVAVITSIGYDHCETLGTTLAAIAGEKAGIVKRSVPVVIGRVPEEAEAVIRARATERDAPVFSVREAFGENTNSYPCTNLEGEYQRVNAATATLVARVLGPKWKLTPEIVNDALQGVQWAARWQRMKLHGRQVILDASHNSEGAAVLAERLQRLGDETAHAPAVVVGVLGEARARPLLEVICRYARELYLVVPHQARACSHAELEAMVPAEFRGRVQRATVAELFPRSGVCVAGVSGDTVVVAGSVYLAGEVLARLEPQRGEGEGRLQDF